MAAPAVRVVRKRERAALGAAGLVLALTAPAHAVPLFKAPSLIFDTGIEALQRVPTREPLKGTREHVEALLEASESAADLIAALQR